MLNFSASLCVSVSRFLPNLFPFSVLRERLFVFRLGSYNFRLNDLTKPALTPIFHTSQLFNHRIETWGRLWPDACSSVIRSFLVINDILSKLRSLSLSKIFCSLGHREKAVPVLYSEKAMFYSPRRFICVVPGSLSLCVCFRSLAFA